MFVTFWLTVNPLSSAAVCPSVSVTTMLRGPVTALGAIVMFAVICVAEL